MRPRCSRSRDRARRSFSAIRAPTCQRLSTTTLRRVRGGRRQFIISRTGYTGEDGFELYFQIACGGCMEHAHESGSNPAGLAAAITSARDGMSLYGNDIDDTVTPLEESSVAVKLKKGEFAGATRW